MNPITTDRFSSTHHAIELTKQIEAGDVRAVARVISVLENRDPIGAAVLTLLPPSPDRAVIIGISGNIGYVWDSPVKYLVATLAIVAVCAVTYVIFLYSKYLTRVLGPSTLHALELFMGFLVCLQILCLISLVMLL